MNNRESDYTQHIDGYQDDKIREYQDKPEETEFSLLISDPEWFLDQDVDKAFTGE